MREILFRSKRVDNGEWVEGYLIKWQDGTASIETGKDGFHIFGVIPETVGQYTGLTDKNGKKIFEGDILKAADENGEIFIYKVVFINGVFGIVIKNGGYVCTLVLLSKKCIEVIGNIHDNKLEAFEDGN